MKYSADAIVKFLIGLVIGFWGVCLTTIVQPFNRVGDLFIRLIGAVMIFVLGFAYGNCERKDGADNER